MKKKINKSLLAWSITAPVLSLVLVAANVAAFVYIPKVMDNVFGGDRGGTRGSKNYYDLDEGITTKAEAKANSDAVNQKICEEGFILLKNEANVLPLSTKETKRKISVFGKNSVNLVYGGSGSGGGDTSAAKTLYESLDSAGYEVNPTLKAFYLDSGKSGSGRPANLDMEAGIPSGFATGETPVSSYTSDVQNSFASYSEMALVVISRTGGEGNDMPKTMKTSSGTAVSGAASADDHYLELDQNEQEMLRLACENFSKVVLVVNACQPMELGFLDATADGDSTMISYDFASHVQGAVWIGGPGNSGVMALGEILNGTVNPSGRTVDTYPRDFTQEPSYVNFGSTSAVPDTYTLNGTEQSSWFVDYEENIYVGYRYYETRAFTENEKGNASWYQNNVVYPFGYGLSYSTFDWSIKNKSSLDGKELKKDDTVTVTVHVANTGSYSGKDVVELYVRTPYTQGGIEKADKVLVDYAKTDLLENGDSGCDVELTFNPYDFASYDDSDANKNGFSGYELEKGQYTFFVSKNSHEAVDSFTMSVSDDITFGSDTTTGHTVSNQFADADDQLGQKLSRTDFAGTFPQSRTAKERETTADFIAETKDVTTNNPLTADSDEVKNSDLKVATKKDKSVTQLSTLIGKDYNDPAWDTFMEGLTLSSISDLCNYAAFGTAAIDYVGKPKVIESDGPAGFVNFMSSSEVYGVSHFASECVVGATWSKDLAQAMGVALGNEGILGDADNSTPYTSLYAPGLNIHRSPFGGRDFEYYSEDPLLNGTMASQFITGAASKGVQTYMKHFVANEGETHRNGVCTWLTEQTLREIYLKPFEIAVKRSKGKAKGLMSSFNRLGSQWTGGDYRLLTTVLREEWGFQGAVICDFADTSYMDLKEMSYAGGDIYLNNVQVSSWVDKSNDLDIYVIKKCAKNYLYLIANSNAMNGLGDGVAAVSSKPAYWKMTLIGIDIGVSVCLVVWGGLVFLLSWRKKKKAANEEAVIKIDGK